VCSKMKFNRFTAIIYTLLLTMLLAACGAGSPSASNSLGTDNTTNSLGTDNTTNSTNNQDSTNTDSPWLATEGDDGSGYTLNCYFSDQDKPGDLISCKVYWDAKNISTIPQEYRGYSYLVVDGATYQSTDAYANSRMINPNAYASNKGGYNSFSLPYGGIISQFFKADGPTETHLLDLPLNIGVRAG
jgi:hypothetical protein